MSKDKVKKVKKANNTENTDEEFPTDWDIDAYRTDYEDEDHWELRRRFMETHKKKFPEDKLVCLAQVFFNMEFMGCKYPSETMLMVAELSKDVARDFRAKREDKLKRTFVAASSAAEQKAKARRTTTQQPTTSGRQQANKRRHFDLNNDEPEPKKAHESLFKDLKYGKFVLHLYGGRNALRISAQRCKMDLQEKEAQGPEKVVEIHLGKQLLTKACEDTVKASKAKAFADGLEILQKHCYSIKLNPLRDTVKIEKTNNRVVCGVNKQQRDTLDEKKLDATNKGYKMMKMMGWTGGGLGSKTQGREEPVGYLLKTDRAGLGNEGGLVDRKYFRQMLTNYVNSEDIRELQFEPSFTKDERAMLHEIAGSMNLKSVSYGKDESRRLVISKKTITNETILTEVLVSQNPTYVNQYLVQVPESKAHLYPDNTAKLELDN